MQFRPQRHPWQLRSVANILNLVMLHNLTVRAASLIVFVVVALMRCQGARGNVYRIDRTGFSLEFIDLDSLYCREGAAVDSLIDPIPLRWSWYAGVNAHRNVILCLNPDDEN